MNRDTARSIQRQLEDSGYWQKFKDFGREKETPFLVVSLDKVKEKYLELSGSIPEAKIFYAIKANPAVEIIKLLDGLGSNFDISSRYELDRILGLGISPDRISYGNTIKKERDIAYAYGRGVRIFATDSEADLLKLKRAAPGVRVFFRINVEGSGADWPLSKKFGSNPDMVFSLIMKAKELGLEPYGLSFHVGSQQRDIGQWDNAIARCTFLFNAAAEKGVQLKMINLGGGLPCSYMHPTHDVKTYVNEIKRFVREDFPDEMPELFIEPGRSLVGDAGILTAEVVNIAKKARLDIVDWVYLDVGVFGGLIETLGEAIKYPIYTEKNDPGHEVILAGPTCDEVDIMYQNFRYSMPDNLLPGDRVYFLSTGAYTTSYSSIEFNGFPPLKTYFI